MTLSGLIRSKGYTVKFFAKKINVTHATILNWNKDKRNISLLANAFFIEKLGKEYIEWITLKQ